MTKTDTESVAQILPRPSGMMPWELKFSFLDQLHKEANSYEDGMATHAAVEAVALEVERYIAKAIQPHLAELEAENKRLREKMARAHAVMRACGWHLALAGEASEDGVLEAAATEIEAEFAAALQQEGKADASE